MSKFLEGQPNNLTPKDRRSMGISKRLTARRLTVGTAAAGLLAVLGTSCGDVTVNNPGRLFINDNEVTAQGLTTPTPIGATATPRPDGIIGPEGKQGLNGKSAYEIALAHGFQGSEQDWLNSLKGSQGLIGPVGPKGEKGEIVIMQPTPSPEATPRLPILNIDLGGGIKINTKNVPGKVDSGKVDTAKGPFKNTIGGGSEGWLATPGGLLVGPDFGYTGSGNPFGRNPEGWKAMYEAGGSIQPFSPVTQDVLRYNGPAFQNLPEGGFILGSWGQARVTIGDVTINMPQRPNNDYIFIARGMYGDNKQDTDRNSTAMVENYKPGHALVNMYQPRVASGLGFIDQDQFVEMSFTAHTAGTNGGDGGNSMLTVVFYDANTSAFVVMQQQKDRALRIEDYAKGWKTVFANFDTNPTS